MRARLVDLSPMNPSTLRLALEPEGAPRRRGTCPGQTARTKPKHRQTKPLQTPPPATPASSPPSHVAVDRTRVEEANRQQPMWCCYCRPTKTPSRAAYAAPIYSRVRAHDRPRSPARQAELQTAILPGSSRLSRAHPHPPILLYHNRRNGTGSSRTGRGAAKRTNKRSSTPVPGGTSPGPTGTLRDQPPRNPTCSRAIETRPGLGGHR